MVSIGVGVIVMFEFATSPDTSEILRFTVHAESVLNLKMLLPDAPDVSVAQFVGEAVYE